MGRDDSNYCNNGNDSNSIVVCRCEEVSRSEILAAIADGATNIRGVKIRTRAGMGACQGKTCNRLVSGIIAAKTGVAPGSLPPNTARPPIHPIEWQDLLEDE